MFNLIYYVGICFYLSLMRKHFRIWWDLDEKFYLIQHMRNNVAVVFYEISITFNRNFKFKFFLSFHFFVEEIRQIDFKFKISVNYFSCFIDKFELMIFNLILFVFALEVMLCYSFYLIEIVSHLLTNFYILSLV